MTFSKHLIEDQRPWGTYWTYRFPNGHTASVIVDKCGSPFRFEVLSSDPDDTGRGGVVNGLTTDQVEAKLAKLAELERNENAE